MPDDGLGGWRAVQLSQNSKASHTNYAIVAPKSTMSLTVKPGRATLVEVWVETSASYRARHWEVDRIEHP